MHALLGLPRFFRDDTIRNFFRRFGQAHIEAFWRPLWRGLLGLLQCPARGFSLDLDSTVFCREGKQEGARKGFNPRRNGRNSHHPLLAVLAEAQFVLHGWLRSGNIVVARLTSTLKRECAGIKDWTVIDGHHATGEFTAQLFGWTQERRFVVVRGRIREAKATVGRRLIDVPGYTLRVWVTNRSQSTLELWRDYNGRACIEQRIEELKHGLTADGFCLQSFLATESAFLAVLCTFNLLSLYQHQTTPTAPYRQPGTLRVAVFLCGAVLGVMGHDLVVKISAAGGGLCKHKPLVEATLN